MTRLIGWIGAMVGGAVGWWLGSRFGIALAFFLSLVGTGAGLYLARRWLRDYLS